MTALLTVEDLHVDFLTPDGTVHAVRGVDLEVNAGETVGIVGESGSGKSVTMLAVMGLLPRKARITGAVHYPRNRCSARRPATYASSGARSSRWCSRTR